MASQLVSVAVFVTSIKKENGTVVVEASNGGADGPPFVRFNIQSGHARDCFIGKRYSLMVEPD